MTLETHQGNIHTSLPNVNCERMPVPQQATRIDPICPIRTYTTYSFFVPPP